jgi:hypothetical protein
MSIIDSDGLMLCIRKKAALISTRRASDLCAGLQYEDLCQRRGPDGKVRHGMALTGLFEGPTDGLAIHPP